MSGPKINKKVSGYTSLKKRVKELIQRVNLLTEVEVQTLDEGVSSFDISDKQMKLTVVIPSIQEIRTALAALQAQVEAAGGDSDLEERVEALEERVAILETQVTQNTSDISTNAGNISENTNAIGNLVDIINDRNPDEQPIDSELLATADKVWTFKFTVDGPGGEPNDVRANFYQVGNRLYCDYTSTNNGTGPNQSNNYLKDSTGSTQSTAINIKLADNGTTYTGNNMNAGITPGDYYKMIFVGGQWYINLYTTSDI